MRFIPKTSLALFFVVLAGAGCKTMDPAAVTNFAASVTAVKTQADDALSSVSTLTLNASVAYAATQPSLKEIYFVSTPTADTIAEWDNALTAIETYAQNLSKLISPNSVNNFDTAATNLFNQFNLTATELNSAAKTQNSQGFTLLATAFTQTAGAILQARAESTAIKIAAATDTNIANICNLFAAEIGSDRLTSPGLRKTVYESVWTPALANLAVPFLSAKTPADKLSISQQYADLLGKRDAEDQILSSLRHSILLLSDAHHALARGGAGSIQADLNVIAGEIQHTHDLYNQFSSLTKK